MWILYFDPEEGEEDYILIEFKDYISFRHSFWRSRVEYVLDDIPEDDSPTNISEMDDRLVIVHQTETLAEMKLHILLES